MATRLGSIHRFNVDDFERMAELGIIPSRPIELIAGRVYAGGRPWRFSTEDYYRLAEAGILTEDERVELIDGEVIDMNPIGVRHAGCVKQILAFLRRRLPDDVVLAVQDPLHLRGGTDPQPDVMVLRARDDFYGTSHPTPSDVLLLVEVADSSLEFDRGDKAELYAAEEIREYWLVNLLESTVMVHTSPSPLGYRSVETRRREDTWTSTMLPALSVRGQDLLG